MICPSCKVERTEDEFHRNKRQPSGRATQCKPCVKADHAARYSDPEYRIRKRALRIKYKYGITLEEVKGMYVNQGGRCAICNVEYPLGIDVDGGSPYTNLGIDHDHETGKVRDLLCLSCNIGLGKFMDNRTILENAVEYLKRHKG